MPSISVASLEALQTNGVLKLTNKVAMVADYSAGALTAPFDADGLLQALPAGYFSTGSIDTDGFTVSRAMSADATNIDQSVQSVRTDVTSDALTIKVKFAESTNKAVLAIDNNLNIADITMSPTFTATRPASGIQPVRRFILVGEDTLRNVVVVKFLPNVTLSDVGDQQFARSTAILYDHTFTVQPDSILLDADGNPTDCQTWIGGSGWAALVGGSDSSSS